MSKKRKSGDGTLRKRSDGRWEARVVIGYDENNLPRTKNVTAVNKDKCLEKLEKLKSKIGMVEHSNSKVDMPFGEWMNFWYQQYVKITLKPTTQSEYESLIYKHIIPEIGNIKLNKFTQNDLQQFYSRLKISGRQIDTEICGLGLSDRMVRACHTLCSMCFEKAVKENLIRTNPAKGCKLPPKKAKEMQVLAPGEMQRFIIQAKADGYFELFVLELCTGMRRGEILGLRWEDFNLQTGELHIRRQVVLVDGNIQISTPKTKSSIRTIIIPADILKILAEYKKRINSRWMFPSPKKPDTPFHPSSLTDVLDRLLKRAECKHIRFHDLRHTFATNALANGMDVKTLSAIIGHISSETTLNIYTHITDNMQRSAANKIEQSFGRNEGCLSEDKQTPNQTEKTPVKPKFEPKQPKIRRPGMGCVYRISDNLWEGSYSPRLPDGKRKKFNVYAKTREECEILLVEMIERVKAEIAEEKAKLKEGDS